MVRREHSSGLAAQVVPDDDDFLSVDDEDESDESEASESAIGYGSLLSLGAGMRKKQPLIVIDPVEAENEARRVQFVALQQFAGAGETVALEFHDDLPEFAEFAGPEIVDADEEFAQAADFAEVDEVADLVDTVEVEDAPAVEDSLAVEAVSEPEAIPAVEGAFECGAILEAADVDEPVDIAPPVQADEPDEIEEPEIRERPARQIDDFWVFSNVFEQAAEPAGEPSRVPEAVAAEPVEALGDAPASEPPGLVAAAPPAASPKRAAPVLPRHSLRARMPRPKPRRTFGQRLIAFLTWAQAWIERRRR